MVCVRSAGMSPSSISLSLNRSRTHNPSDLGREVKVFRVSDSESPNSRTKYTPLISRRSIAITVPEVFSNSSLPSLTNCAGDTYPETESRSIFRTMTFLCVEGMKTWRWTSDLGPLLQTSLSHPTSRRPQTLELQAHMDARGDLSCGRYFLTPEV